MTKLIRKCVLVPARGDYPELSFNQLKIGPLSIERDSITLRISKSIWYNVNISWPGYGTDNIIVGNEDFGPGKRLEFSIWPFGHWLISLDQQRFGKWTLREGYRGDKVGRMRWNPPKSLDKWIICKNPTGATAKSYCGAFRWHRCPYAS